MTAPYPARVRVAIVGGYGAFGQRLAERLARDPGIEVVIAGRNPNRAAHYAAALSASTGQPCGHAVIDAGRVSAAVLRDLNLNIIVNASGPFQRQDYTLQRAAIGAGCHVLDLADARAYVTGIGVLDAEARDAGLLVVSGVSSVPGLSSAILAEHAPAFAAIREIDIAISPGNSFTPGKATMASILDSLGRPFNMHLDGRAATVHGWQGVSRLDFGALGARWLGFVDVPDLALLPEAYPDAQTVRFRAGVEVPLFHFGLYGLSWLVRSGFMRRPARWAAPLLRLKRFFDWMGSDSGGMVVRLTGTGGDGNAREIETVLIARQSHGPYVPVLGAVALISRLARGTERRTGARPCLSMFTVGEFEAAAQGLDIAFHVTKR